MHSELFKNRYNKGYPVDINQEQKDKILSKYTAIVTPNYKSIITPGFEKETEEIFMSKGDDYTDILDVYLHLGRERASLYVIDSKSESEFNEYIKLNPVNYYNCYVEDFNYMSGFVFQMEKKYWNSPAFAELDERVKNYFSNIYLPILNYAKEHGPSDEDELIYLSTHDYSMMSMQSMRSIQEYILVELRYIEEKHRFINPEFVRRIKATADWLDQKLQETDSVLKKLFWKKDNRLLTPRYYLGTNQNHWWYNLETIKKLMEENG